MKYQLVNILIFNVHTGGVLSVGSVAPMPSRAAPRNRGSTIAAWCLWTICLISSLRSIVSIGEVLCYYVFSSDDSTTMFNLII